MNNHKVSEKKIEELCDFLVLHSKEQDHFLKIRQEFDYDIVEVPNDWDYIYFPISAFFFGDELDYETVSIVLDIVCE